MKHILRPALGILLAAGLTLSASAVEVDSREVYLPAGASWTDAWTGKVYEGGQTITAAAPIDTIPLYLKDGAKLPIAE